MPICTKDSMSDSDKSWEELIVPTTCTDKDTDIIVQAKIDKELGLQDVDELSD